MTQSSGSRSRRKIPHQDLAERVLAGDPAAVGRALSLVIDEREGYENLFRVFFRHSGRCQKIGLSGPPGGGKSSLVNRLISVFRKSGLKIGVLAVDPTSPFTGGAFLGDRLRFQDHAMDPGVFFRSLASRGMSGGLSATIFGAIHVLEASGCDKILIETIGAGQDEVSIGRVADTVVFVTTPFLGDEIQAMKAGTMEIADIFVVNKAELPGADKAAGDIKTAMDFGGGAKDAEKWAIPVLQTSALRGQGIEDLVRQMEAHWESLRRTGEGNARRRIQLREELSLFVSRRVVRDILGKISEKDIDQLLLGKADPIGLGSKLLKG